MEDVFQTGIGESQTVWCIRNNFPGVWRDCGSKYRKPEIRLQEVLLYAFEKFLKFEEVQLNNKINVIATRVATAIATIYWYQLANLCNCYCEAKR